MSKISRIVIVILLLSAHALADPLCSEQDPAELEKLRITAVDRNEICALITNRHDFYIVLIARSHEDLYDFPMIEVHMAPISIVLPTTGPVFFYWKREGEWSELEEVSVWTKRTNVD